MTGSGSYFLLPRRLKTLHSELSSFLSTYDVNSAADSVKVYALKPGYGTTEDSTTKPGALPIP